MNSVLENVVEALRNELQQYGELLALLEAQQGGLERHDIWLALDTAAALDAQRAIVEVSRHQRKDAHRKLAWAAGCPDAQTFAALRDLVPPQYRELLEALIRDINQASAQVRGRVINNHSLLRSALTLTEQLIATFSPQGDSALLVGEWNSSGAESPSVTISAAIV